MKGITEGASRTAEIVKGLRNFSRTDEAELKKADMNESLDSTVMILQTKLKDKNIEVEELCIDIIKDIQSLIYRLKYYYQRPRPYQIAQYLKLKLFPYKSFSSHTPSFPCGHCLESFVILNVIGNKYPTQYPFCKELIEDIAYSRIYLGHHYPSDNEGAKEVGKAILKHPEFVKKYGI